MDVNAIGRLLHYHYGMFERVWECANDLTGSQFVAESDYSFGSVRNHFVHCLNVDRRWLARLEGGAPPPRLNPGDYADQDALRDRWEQVRQRVLAYVGSLTEQELNETVHVELGGAIWKRGDSSAGKSCCIWRTMEPITGRRFLRGSTNWARKRSNKI